MQRHLRADKVHFWTKLLPSVTTSGLAAFASAGQGGSSFGPAGVRGGCESVGVRETSLLGWTWVLVAVVVLQGALLCAAALFVARMRRKYRKLTKASARQRPAAKV